MNIVVIDGQGGGLGKSIIEKLKEKLNKSARITAIGTNALATSAMLKAGADDGATGENAVIINVLRADIIIGAMGIVIANSMMGELTERMAIATASSQAHKVLIPLNRCGITIAGVSDSRPVVELIDDAVRVICNLVND